MKRIFYILVLLVLNFTLKAQTTYPLTQNLGSSGTLVKVPVNGGMQAVFVPTPFADTTAANAVAYVKYTAGATIRTTGDNKVWRRNEAKTAWLDNTSGSVDFDFFEFLNDSTLIICFADGSCDTVDFNNNNVFVTNNTLFGGCNNLLSGGIVTANDPTATLVFDVTAADYTIGCKAYNTSATQVTLPNGHATLGRFDVIAVDTNETVIVIEGTPSADPQVPQIDHASQLALTTILVPAGATTASQLGITQTVIYDQNLGIAGGEWDGAATSWTSDRDNLSFPFHLTKSDLISGGTGSTSQFSWADTDTMRNGQYDVFKFYIRLTDAWVTGLGFDIAFYNGTTKVSNSVIFTNNSYGFDQTVTGSYQIIAIPMAQFTLTDSIYFSVVFKPLATPFSSQAFRLDWIQLQGGVYQALGGSSGLYWWNQYSVPQPADGWVTGNLRLEGNFQSPQRIAVNGTTFYTGSLKAGAFAIAGASEATVFGEWARGTTAGAISIGSQAGLSGGNGHGITIAQYGTTSSSTSVNIGGLTNSGTGNVNLGINSAITASQAVAIGETAQVTATNGVAIGYNAVVSGAGSIVIGRSVSQSGVNTIVIGTQSAAGTSTQAVLVGGASTIGNGINGVTLIGYGASHSTKNNATLIGNGISSTGRSTGIGTGSVFSADNNTGIGEQVNIQHNYAIGLGFGATTTAANQLVMGADINSGTEGGLNDIYWGEGVLTVSPNNISLNANSGSGTNIAGGTLSYNASRGTGTGTPGVHIFQVSTALGSGTTLQTLTPRIQINGSGILSYDGVLPTSGSGGTDSVVARNSSTGQFYLTTGGGASLLFARTDASNATAAAMYFDVNNQNFEIDDVANMTFASRAFGVSDFVGGQQRIAVTSTLTEFYSPDGNNALRLTNTFNEWLTATDIQITATGGGVSNFDLDNDGTVVLTGTNTILVSATSTLTLGGSGIYATTIPYNSGAGIVALGIDTVAASPTFNQIVRKTASAGGGTTWNGITDPTGAQALTFQAGENSVWTDQNTTADNLTINSSTGTTNSLISLNRTGTALAAGNNIMELISSGANGTNAITATGLNISVTNTNATSGTNKALTLTSSGATTANYALEVTAGQTILPAGTGTLPAMMLSTTVGIYNQTGTDLGIHAGTIARAWIGQSGMAIRDNTGIIDLGNSGMGGTNSWRLTGGTVGTMKVATTGATAAVGIQLSGGEGALAFVDIYADEGDDVTDKGRIEMQIDGDLAILNNTTEKNLIQGANTTLTEATATTFITATVASGAVAGGSIVVTVEANDATEYQSRTLRFIWTASNKAGTTTITISTPEEVAAVSAGTLTATITATDGGSGVISFKADATSSLTQTTLRANAQLIRNF